MFLYLILFRLKISTKDRLFKVSIILKDRLLKVRECKVGSKLNEALIIR
jgi:hypothetical protein